MSNKDISRFLFQPVKHYTGMRMQQGRVLLDSDYNEGALHAAEDERRTLRDLIGPQGTPDTTGFALGTFDGTNFAALQPGTLGFVSVQFDGGTAVNVPAYYVGPGVMYVGGLRVELEQAEFIAFQRDYLQASAASMPNMFPDGASSASSGDFLHFFYLHVWEQCVTAVEDDEFLEHALGGPDTSVRVRRMRRVEFAFAEEGENCAQALERVLGDKFGQLPTFHPETGELVSNGRLQIGFVQGQSDDTCAPCAPDATGRYLGAENQAIRIMLTSPTTYVWAIDDGAPLYRASLSGVSPTATQVSALLLSLPKDEEHWPQSGRVVEILPWSAVLENGEKVADDVGVADGLAVFCPAIDYDPAKHILTLDTSAVAAKLDALIRAWDSKHPEVADASPVIGGQGTPHLPSAPSDPRFFYLRFWHKTDPATPVEIPTNNGVPLGATGLLPKFVQQGVPGDFWIAAVRPETPTVIIPTSLQDDAGDVPAGPRNFYAPLALVTGTTNSTGTLLTLNTVEDCRRPMVPVTDTGCCTVIVGDGVKSFGQYTSIQAAINALPPEGGHVCIRPGIYREEIIVQNRVDVTLSGCGDLTVIQSPDSTTPAPALVQLMSGRRFTAHSLTIKCTAQSAILVQGVNSPRLFDLKVEAIPPDDPATPDDSPVVHVFSCSGVDIGPLTILASRRTGLFVESVSGLEELESTGGIAFARVHDITIAGAFTSAAAPTQPAGPLAVVHSGVFALDNWNLLAFGQVGLECSDLQLDARHLTIRSEPFSPAAPAKSALDIFEVGYNGDGPIVIKDSEFTISASTNTFVTQFQGPITAPSDHAAVVLGIARVAFENNRVLANGICWGGIQIRNGTHRLRNNQIGGGAGHGITLGSVLWYPQGSDPTKATRREGAGKHHMLSNGQVTGDLRDGFIDDSTGIKFLPHSEFGPGQVEITGNIITDCGTNGISVLTLFGLPGGEPLFVLTRTSAIRNNTITGNLNTATAAVPLADVILPIGGSRLGSVPSHNVPLRVLPLGGIVLGGSAAPDNSPPSGEGTLDLEISGNVVEDNGVNATTLPVSGIFVFATTSATIANNRIARNGPLTQPADVLQTGIRSGISVLLAGAMVSDRGEIETFLDDAASPPPSRYTLQVIGNTVEQREGRALFAVGTGSMAIEDNFFSSLGFHGSTASPEALADILAIGDVVYVHNLGRPWESVNFSASSGPPPGNFLLAAVRNYLSDSGTNTYSLPPNVFFVGVGGHTLFSNNHVVYDWNVQQHTTFEPLTYAAVALVSLDHVGVHTNQFGLRLLTSSFTGSQPPPPLAAPPAGSAQSFGGRFILTNVLAVGFTVDANSNRVSEGLDDCEASIFATAITMASVTNNITTHCVALHTHSGDPVQNVGNLSVLRPSDGVGCTTLQGVLSQLGDEFLNLLFDQRSG